MPLPKKTHLLARAVVKHNDHFLLARQRGTDTTFLPGGHVENGEGLIACLRRELQEELGVEVAVGRYLGAIEAEWENAFGRNYEVNHCFEVKSKSLTTDSHPESKEPHIEFLWANPDDFIWQNLKPAPLRHLLAGSADSAWWATTLSEQG